MSKRDTHLEDRFLRNDHDEELEKFVLDMKEATWNTTTTITFQKSKSRKDLVKLYRPIR